MIHLAILLLSLMGFTGLALATSRAQEVVFPRRLGAACSFRLRLAGWAALAGALSVAVVAHGWAYGLVSYSGHTSLAAGLVFAALIAIGQRRART